MGYLRLLLLASVLLDHLSPLHWRGTMCVFGFYTMAGFLMTLIINEDYGTSMRGKALFVYNRILRLYPLYYACLLASFAIVLVTGVMPLNPAFRMPVGLYEWLPQLTIMGLNGPGPESFPVRLVPTAWSLDIEIVYYLLIGLVIGTSRTACLAWFLLALALTVYWPASGVEFNDKYRTWEGPMLTFAAGSVCFHWRSLLLQYAQLPWAAALLLAAGVIAFMGSQLHIYRSDIEWFSHYAAIFAFAVLMMCVHGLENKRGISKLNRWCGDLSYPFFLMHWQVGVLVMHGGFAKGWLFFFITVLLAFLLSALLVYLVDRPLTPVRDAVRRKARHHKKGGAEAPPP